MRLHLQNWILLLLAGLVLANLFFGGLWLTLQRLPQWHHPFLGLGLSLLGRLAILFGGGAWLLHAAIAPPLPAILLIGLGFWLGRTFWITHLLARV